MKCKNCGVKFTPRFFNVKFCEKEACRTKMIQAVLTKQSEAKEKKQRKVTKGKKEALKTKSEHLKDTQTIFNKFIRLRDKDLPCISWQKFHTGQYHAGHYMSVGSTPELRFHELNNNKQCSVCNNHKHGNLIHYRVNLIIKIGEKAVEGLEGFNNLKHYTIEDLKYLQAHYKGLIKELKEV